MIITQSRIDLLRKLNNRYNNDPTWSDRKKACLHRYDTRKTKSKEKDIRQKIQNEWGVFYVSNEPMIVFFAPEKHPEQERHSVGGGWWYPTYSKDVANSVAEVYNQIIDGVYFYPNQYKHEN